MILDRNRSFRSLFVLLALSSAVTVSGCGGEAMDEDAIPLEDSDESALVDDEKADGIGYRATLRYAHRAGLPCNSRAVVAAAVAMAESSLRATAVNYNDNGSWDYGLWQINSIHGYTQRWLAAPANNAEAMARVSSNGSNFRPWTVYRNGTYRRYLNAAWAARNAGACQ